MITSLIDMLRDCPPVHAAWSEAEMLSKTVGQTPPASFLKRFMLCQGPGDAATVAAQPVPNITPNSFWERVSSNWGLREAVLSARLWSWTKGGPNTMTQMNCRAREAGYKLHAVLPKVTYGLDGAAKVKVKTKQGQELLLPLEAKYIVGQFFVQGGTIPKGRRTLWPLEARHDSGLVVVFVYELSFDGAGKIKEPLAPFAPSGAGKWTPVRAGEKTTLEQMAPASVPDKDGWLEVMTGPFMQIPGGSQQTSALTNDDKTTKVLRPRIVVALSTATCRERADFEPGGLVGMAKIFPNILVASSIPLSNMHGTVKIERSPATTALDGGNGTSGGTCCGAYTEVGSMFVADANETGALTQKPFWGGTFAYVETAAHVRFAGKRLKMVDRSKTTTRSYAGGKRLLVRRHIDGPSNPFSTEYWKSLFGLRSIELTGVEKVPGQGEFDNLHLAPALKLDLAKTEYMIPGGEFAPPTIFVNKNNPATTHTDKIWMAPFCSHDCFHTHWRWGSKESAEWTKGWSATGPFKESGAAMVPLHQDVEMELHSASSFSYHAHSTYGNAHVPGTWDVVMHHGSAYAQSIADWMKFAGSQFNISFENSNTTFYDSAGKMLGIDKPALMYWLFRYEVDGQNDQVIVRERVQFTTAEVDGARKT